MEKIRKDKFIPYRRKALYLLLTTPMMALYIAVAVFLWEIKIILFAVYASLFVLVASFMSYVCVYWQCPYIGKFAPCVGGFCLPSSQIAGLMKNAKRSKPLYIISLTMAYVSFFGIILFPIYPLYLEGFIYLMGYIGMVTGYGLMFTLFICPVCGTRHICPGGKTAVKMKAVIDSQCSKKC